MTEYILVVSELHVVDGLGLEPGAGVSKLIGNDSCTVEIGVIVVYLGGGIGPAVSDGHSFQVQAVINHESVVFHDFRSKGRNVVPCK